MTVVVCHCVHRRRVDSGRLEELRQAVSGTAHRLVDVPDLCAAAAAGDAGLAADLVAPGVVLCGCHGRALQALATRLAGRCLPDLRLVDLCDPPVGDPLRDLGLTRLDSGQGPAVDLPTSDDAWFPLIDADRCVDCGQCLSFCLFGVYARAGSGPVVVRHPLNCKTDCPACARVCPENAVIFPKCQDDAINGAARSAEQLRGARIRLRPDEVFGGDLRAKLAARRAAATRPLLRPGAFAEIPEPEPGDPNPGGQGT